MRILGLIGGMSWESTIPYYRGINDGVKARLGGRLAGIAKKLESSGAQALVLCTNTMHKVAGAIEAAVRIPLLHIVDPTAAELRRLGITSVGLLGTRFTMEQAFYRERLSARHGTHVLTPPADEREVLHRIIYDELCRGQLRPESRQKCRAIIVALENRGAGAVILGCTELSLLIGAADSPVPLLDTTALHAQYAADWSLRIGP